MKGSFSQGTGALLLSLLMAMCVAAQTQPPPANGEASDQRATGAITGRVVNESGQALPNAAVSVRAVNSPGQGFSTITDRDGNFKVTNLERVSYMVSARMPAYVTAPREPNSKPPNEQYKVGDSVTFVLIKGGVITGTVTNAAGEPVIAVGVRVQLVGDTEGRRMPSGGSVRETTTDDRGVYRVYGLRSGTYIVVAGGRNDQARSGVKGFELDIPTFAPSSNRETAEEFSVRTGEETANVDIRYRGERGRIISGTVGGSEGESMGINVTLTVVAEDGAQQDSNTYIQARLREFSFTGLSDGNYFVTARGQTSDGRLITSEPKAVTVSGADVVGIELMPRLMASISGRVVLEETKAPECTEKTPLVFKDLFVAAWHNDNQMAKNQPKFLWAVGVPVNPDDQGNISIRNLAAGQYYFAARFPTPAWYLQSIAFAPASAAGAKAGKPTDATRVWTTLRAGEQLSRLTITLAQGAASLRGSLAPAEGEPRPGPLTVYLVPAEPERAGDVLRFYGAAVTADGNILLQNLAPGRYWVLAKPGAIGPGSPLSKLRWPDATETRAKLRREAEAVKTEIELEPCQQVTDFRLPPKLPNQ